MPSLPSHQGFAKRLLLWGLVPVVALASWGAYYVAVHQIGYSRAERTVESEIAALPDHEWAGDYYFGDGRGVNVSLSLAPDAGFVFSWYGCLGEYDRNYGGVAEKDGFLVLTPRLRNERRGFQGIATEFLPVRWGKRYYLIASDELVDFCDAVNQDREPRDDAYGSFLLRDGDWQTAVEGSPDLPPEYSKYLLPSPLLAEIVALGPRDVHVGSADIKFNITKVTLNVGKQDGVLPGMGFVLVKPDGMESALAASIEVTELREHECEAKITQVGDQSSPPQVGWQLSTRRQSR